MQFLPDILTAYFCHSGGGGRNLKVTCQQTATFKCLLKSYCFSAVLSLLFFSLFVTLALPATFVYCVKTSKDMAIIAMECE